MKEPQKIAHPLFIASVFLLILNDWYFKTTFHNELTGKLSDFAGLFAFPFFFSVLFPQYKKAIHSFTGALFIFWNSEFSQGLIDFFNSAGIPIGRTVDITDNMALVSIFASYKFFHLQHSYELRPIFRGVLITISCAAFLATSRPPQKNNKFVGIDKEYEFDFSKRELISRLNMVQIKEIQRLNKYSGQVDFDAERNVFHYQGRTDTLALLLDERKIQEQDTVEFKTSYAEIMVSGNQSEAKLKLLAVYKITLVYKDVDYKEKAIKQFEKRIIKKIRKYR